MVQEIRHPREIQWIGWRVPRNFKYVLHGVADLSDDAHLYTVTMDTVLRVYSPVLDDPLWFQLLSSLDSKAFSQTVQEEWTTPKGKTPETSSTGTFWVMDSEILRQGLAAELAHRQGDQQTRKTMQGLEAEESDVVVWLAPDGRMAMRSIVVSIVDIDLTTEHGPQTAYPS
jgi:hypothetical protein